MMPSGLVKVLQFILHDVGVLDATVVVEARGLRATDWSRPGDIVALDFFANGKYLVIDAVMTLVYRSTILPKVATILGYASKQTKDMKFMSNKTSQQPIAVPHGGPHVLVPSAIKDRG